MPLLLDASRLMLGRMLIGLGLLVAVAALYVRLAPSDPRRWHIEPERIETSKQMGYRATAVFKAEPQQLLATLDGIALSTPRTKRLAGSPESGLLTYVTRSRLWGFPDYTTVSARRSGDQTELTVVARLRFGVGDGGVNRARVKAWLQALQAVEK